MYIPVHCICCIWGDYNFSFIQLLKSISTVYCRKGCKHGSNTIAHCAKHASNPFELIVIHYAAFTVKCPQTSGHMATFSAAT